MILGLVLPYLDVHLLLLRYHAFICPLPYFASKIYCMGTGITLLVAPCSVMAVYKVLSWLWRQQEPCPGSGAVSG